MLEGEQKPSARYHKISVRACILSIVFGLLSYILEFGTMGDSTSILLVPAIISVIFFSVAIYSLIKKNMTEPILKSNSICILLLIVAFVFIVLGFLIFFGNITSHHGYMRLINGYCDVGAPFECIYYKANNTGIYIRLKNDDRTTLNNVFLTLSHCGASQPADLAGNKSLIFFIPCDMNRTFCHDESRMCDKFIDSLEVSYIKKGKQIKASSNINLYVEYEIPKHWLKMPKLDCTMESMWKCTMYAFQDHIDLTIENNAPIDYDDVFIKFGECDSTYDPHHLSANGYTQFYIPCDQLNSYYMNAIRNKPYNTSFSYQYRYGAITLYNFTGGVRTINEPELLQHRDITCEIGFPHRSEYPIQCSGLFVQDGYWLSIRNEGNETMEYVFFMFSNCNFNSSSEYTINPRETLILNVSCDIRNNSESYSAPLDNDTENVLIYYTINNQTMLSSSVLYVKYANTDMTGW
jgi:hypothetical protein